MSKDEWLKKNPEQEYKNVLDTLFGHATKNQNDLPIKIYVPTEYGMRIEFILSYLTRLGWKAWDRGKEVRKSSGIFGSDVVDIEYHLIELT